MFTIKWVLKDDPAETIHESPNVFTAERAAKLCNIANEEFDRAFHWTAPV